MRKTLVFKNIQVQRKVLSKSIVAQEINKVILEKQFHQILSKIEGAFFSTRVFFHRH